MVATLTEALRNALPALEENADDECAFWGDDHDLAKDAVKIHEAAKSALANASGEPCQPPTNQSPKYHE